MRLYWSVTISVTIMYWIHKKYNTHIYIHIVSEIDTILTLTSLPKELLWTS